MLWPGSGRFAIISAIDDHEKTMSYRKGPCRLHCSSRYRMGCRAGRPVCDLRHHPRDPQRSQVARWARRLRIPQDNRQPRHPPERTGRVRAHLRETCAGRWRDRGMDDRRDPPEGAPDGGRPARKRQAHSVGGRGIPRARRSPAQVAPLVQVLGLGARSASFSPWVAPSSTSAQTLAGPVSIRARSSGSWPVELAMVSGL